MNFGILKKVIYLKIKNDEIWLIPQKDNKILVYAPLREYLGVYTPDFYKAVEKEKKNNNISKTHIGIQLKDYLSKYQIIEVNELIGHENREVVLRDLNIVLSNFCNLACVYCHSDAGFSKDILSIDLVKIAIDKLVEDCISLGSKIVRLQFAGGGEPTIHFQLIKEIVDYLRKKCKECGLLSNVVMPTNGVYPTEIAEEITTIFNGVSLSFDGPKEITDLHRPMKGGTSSFDMVMNTAKIFQRKSFPFAIRSTISNKTIEMAYNFFDFFTTNFPGVQIGLEPLNPIGRGAKLHNTIKSPSKKAFSNFLLEAYQKSLSSGFQFLNSAVGKFNLLRAYYCMSIGQPAMTILPNGDVAACTRAGSPNYYHFGTISEKKGISLEKKSIERLKNSNVTNYKNCEKCFCKYNCGGGCLDLRLTGNLRCTTVRDVGNILLRHKVGLPIN